MENTKLNFADFLDDCFEKGTFATDDVIAFVLPIMEEVLSFHENNLVAPFGMKDAIFITNNKADIDETLAHKASHNTTATDALWAAHRSKIFEITGRTKWEADMDTGVTSSEEQNIFLQAGQAPYPAYVKGYKCYEQDYELHDAHTDIFCLGLILGSAALGLNLEDEDDLKTFANFRTTPVKINPRIHPTIAGLITEMTELDRQRRSGDLYDVIHRLNHYRDYNPEKQTDLSSVFGAHSKDIKTRSNFILNKLHNRLFDNSKRNRLLYYKPNARFVNLSVSSVPMVMNYQSIKPEHLFTWNADTAKNISGAKEILLNKYLRFEDHAYLPSSLDKIRLESQRDVQEFGFSQLKLVIAFLNWHNLKEDANERIQSPLLLVPVELRKVKKLKEDHYQMKVLSSEAEINPVLANQMKELYGIKLPDFIDLTEINPIQFFESFKKEIDHANQGIHLQLIDKPRIKLVHSIAKNTISNYRKRLRKATDSFGSYKNIAYSYRAETYNPLGLAIFKQKIEPKPNFLEFLVDEDVQLKNNLTGDGDKERSLYQLTESEENPYNWDFDLCNIVLGNFNYKKMSLVRDYNQLMELQPEHLVFEELFSNKPKHDDQSPIPFQQPEEWHHVITADPTQSRAILFGRTGKSYIIQGPPGTGKSQTITNLIADYLAQQKTILFVCEKRAALDVVYHRLKQNGLDQLCCYIHDSQGDKRAFIKNLKDTYESFLKNKEDANKYVVRRNALLLRIQQQIELLTAYHDAMGTTHDQSGIPAYELLQKLATIKSLIPNLQHQESSLLPMYADWQQHASTVQKITESLEESGAEPVFALHVMSTINDELYLQQNPIGIIENLAQTLKRLLNEIEIFTQGNKLDNNFADTIAKLKELVLDAKLLEPLALSGNLDVVDQKNPKAKAFDKAINNFREKQQTAEKAAAENSNWIEKFSEGDVENAISIAQAKENSFFKFLSGDWNNLKRKLQAVYRFDAHAVKPSFSTVLEKLKAEYVAINEAKNAKAFLQNEFGVDNIETVFLGVDALRHKQTDQEVNYLLQHPSAQQTVLNVVKASNLVQQTDVQLKQLLSDYETKNITDLKDKIENITMNLNSLQELLPAMQQFARLPNNIKNVMRALPFTPAQAEAAIANKSWQSILANYPSVSRTDAQQMEKAIEDIELSYQGLLKVNAQLILTNAIQEFKLHVDISNTALSQLNPDEKEFKKTYAEGRKILENEFGKSMRYKSIRELSTKESGQVLKDIKPVWLMSPLSVSDSLPLDANFFDVVIFDEASQITLEEGVPSLFRAPQSIIVGDDKQMPPTNFFTAKAGDPDDLEIFDGEQEDEILSADSDSLLVQGTRKLPSTMLSWHYRSRYETLISYSNHAFYDADLLTIPDRTIHHNPHEAIEVKKPDDAVEFSNRLYDRTISYHYLPNAVYEKRSNNDEAQYIAHLVRELLTKKVNESIGIVAFSQEQQSAIETELDLLAADDKKFEALLEEAYERTDDDQFTGLIIKNLENIQGDERDIIIMSVCYGFDQNRRMLMNFGPVNKKGGEKRLNVLFSRAKKHIAVVSSIKYQNITNEYNEGANYFRRFLQYAENVSTGNMQLARTILDSLVAHKTKTTSALKQNTIAQQIINELKLKGYKADPYIGQSEFKCSVAVKENIDDEAYTLGILIDDQQHYANENLMEQYYQRPSIMKSFGWKIIQVYSKDWYENNQQVLQQIIKRLHEKPIEPKPDTLEILLPIDEQPNASEISAKTTIDEPAWDKWDVPQQYQHIQFETLVFKEGNSDKFWETGMDDNKLIIRFGRTGTRGQVQLKTFADAEKAKKEMEKLIAEKKNKGYHPK